MTGGGGSGGGGGGVFCSVSCSVGGGFRSNSSGGGGSECHDDRGMEEVVTWKLFMFMIFFVSFRVRVSRAKVGVYRISPIGYNFTCVELSEISEKMSEKQVFLAKNKRFVNIKLILGSLQLIESSHKLNVDDFTALRLRELL